jgi:hypothetical protein
MRLLILCCLVLFSLPCNAKEIAGVLVQEVVQTEAGVTLHLNGAGVRSKFFVDVYLAQLFLEKPSTAVEEVIAAEGQKRVVMHFLHSEVARDKLVAAWDEGFVGNTPAAELAKLEERIGQFNAMFGDAKKNDVIVLDYQPAVGTVVQIANETRGTIPGKDFNDALLRIWLGDKPVNKGLKEQLLGLK